MNNNILENSISNIDDDLIEMTAQKLLHTRPRKTALNIIKFAGRFAGIAAAAAVLCVAVQLGMKQYNDRLIQSGAVSGADSENNAPGDAVIMPPEDFVKLSNEQATEVLRGLTLDEFILAWGSPTNIPDSPSMVETYEWQSGSKVVRVIFRESDPEDSTLYASEVLITDAPETLPLDFKAQYIRTGGLYDPDYSYPKTALIKDTGELEKYISDNSEKYGFGDEWDGHVSFYQAVSGYDEKFFKDHCLLFVVLQEGSGSIRHNVKKVEYDPKRGTIIPTIEHIIPEIGTCDMAEWHIVIELDAKYNSPSAIDLKEEIIQLSSFPEPDPDPFFGEDGVTYADILEYGYEERLGFKVKNMEDQPDFQKYLPSSFYHTVYDIAYVFDDYSITACKYGEDFHPAILNKDNIEEYDYRGFTFYEHPANTIPELIIYFDDNDIVYYCRFADPGSEDAVRDRIIEIINVSAPEPVDPDNKPDFFSGEKDCSYADILKRGYENSLGFKVKNMEQRPDFKKYSVWLMYPGTGKEAAGSITYFFADHSITACKYDEGIHPDFLDKYFIEEYDYKGTTFSRHPSHPDYIVFFDENDTAYYCHIENLGDADAVRDRIIEIINA